MAAKERRRSQVATTVDSDGGTAYLTVVSLLCGFSFAGLVLYLGLAKPRAGQEVAAGLLFGAFVMLLYCVFAFASLVHSAEGGARRSAAYYSWEATWSMLVGLVLLLGSLCVMGFIWARSLGWATVGLSAWFIGRFLWASLRDLLLRHSQ